MDNYSGQTGYFKDTTPEPELILDDTGKTYLLETARWAKFLAVLGFVFLGFYILGGIALAFSITMTPEVGAWAKGLGATGILLLYSIVVFIIVYPLYALYRYTILVKRAINSNDRMTLNEALRFHRNYYRYNGIITIVMIGLYALVFLLVISIGMLGAN
jgi:hypothetical protein